MYKLLIVEDEDIVRNYLANSINWNSIGAEIVGVESNGFKGIEKAYEKHPDIIIADIKMPNMNGLEMIGKIQKFLPAVKSIIISGYNDFEFAREAIELKASCYLLKPFEDEELLCKVKKVIDELDEADSNKSHVTSYNEYIKILDDGNIIYRKADNSLRELYYSNKYDLNIKIADIIRSIILSLRALDYARALIGAEDLANAIKHCKSLPSIVFRMVIERVITDISTAVAEIDNDAITINEAKTVEEILAEKNIFGLKVKLQEFITEVTDAIKARVNSEERILKKVFEIIEEEYMDGVTLSSIADRIYLSANYLGQIFIRATGKTYNSYLNDLRMQKAKELLTNSEFSIHRIAKRVGINNETYFCTLFRNYFGVSPGKYRKMTALNLKLS